MSHHRWQQPLSFQSSALELFDQDFQTIIQALVGGDDDCNDGRQHQNQNHYLKSLTIHSQFLYRISNEEAKKLWNIIASTNFPQLEYMAIFFGDYEASIKALITILKNQQQSSALRKLIVGNVNLADNEDDNNQMKQLAKTFEQHPTLQEIDFCGIVPHDNLDIDPLLLSFSTIPHLQKLSISVRHRLNLQQSEGLQLLCQSRTLRELKLVRIDLSNECFISIHKELQVNTKLKSFALFGSRDCPNRIQPESWNSVSQMLQDNVALETLIYVNLKGMNNTACIALANGLQHNQSLKELYLFGDQRFLAAKDRITRTGHEAFARMLEKNTVMEQLLTNNASVDKDLRHAMDYYLRLNRLGLRNLHLHVNTTHDKFVNKMIDQVQDLNHLYYMIFSNPSLVEASI